MLSFLRTLFKNKPGKEEMNVEEIGSWIERKTTPAIEGLNGLLKARIDEIKAQVDKIKESSVVLENAEIKNQEGVVEKVKHVVMGNKAQYLKLLDNLIGSAEFPEEIDAKSVILFCSDMNQRMDSFSKSSIKPYYTTQHLFADEVEAIANELNALGGMIKKVQEEIEKSGVKRIYMLRKKAKEFKEAIEYKKTLENEIESKKKEIENAMALKSKHEQEMVLLENSEDALRGTSKKEQMNEADNKLMELRNRAIEIFSPLETPLKKFKRMTVKEELVDAYIISPIDAFVRDEKPFIIEELGKMKAAIISGSLEMRDDKKERAVENINKISEQQLRQMRTDYIVVRSIKETLEKQVKTDRFFLKKKDIEYKIEHYAGKLKRIGEEMDDIEKSSDKISLEQLKAEIEARVKEAVGIETVISF